MKIAQVILAGVTVVGGLVLIACALYLPPQGQIDPTVLVAYGEALTFAGAVIGVDYHYKSKSDKEENNNKSNN